MGTPDRIGLLGVEKPNTETLATARVGAMPGLRAPFLPIRYRDDLAPAASSALVWLSNAGQWPGEHAVVVASCFIRPGCLQR